MSSDSSFSSFKFGRRSSSKLQKDPPSFTSRILKGHQSTSLKRHPSAPVYPRSSGPGREHTRTRSNAYGSSSSSLDQNNSASPILPGSDYQPSRPTRLSLNEQPSEELIGAPFDSRGMLDALDENVAETDHYQQEYQPSPPPLQEQQQQQHQQQSPPQTLYQQPSYQQPAYQPVYQSSSNESSRGLRQSTSFTALQNKVDLLPQRSRAGPQYHQTILR